MREEKKRKNYLERYKKIGQSKWFKDAYENMTLGDKIELPKE